MFIRALRIGSSIHYDSEIDKIYSIGKNFCYTSAFLDECLTRAKRSFYGNNSNRINSLDR